MTTDELLKRWSDGSITADELRELTAELAKPEHQSALLDDWLLESSLPDRLPGAAVAGLQESAMNRRIERIAPVRANLRANQWAGWLSWRPIAAAAAGIVFGMFCTSMVFAYVAPSLVEVITLLQDDFESGPAPDVTGPPSEVGKWGGDYTEVVGAQQGVKSASGKKMLRFLRGDFAGRDIPSSHSSDVFRLVDVRPYRHQFADSGAVVQLTALFNAAPFPEETFSATLTLFALDASLVGSEVIRAENVLSTESLAFSRSSKLMMDRDPATWQKVSNELRLPPGTEFLMIRMGMSNDTKSQDKRRDSFAGHFTDKLQLVIARRPEIPVP